jgi:hypothetical protein
MLVTFLQIKKIHGKGNKSYSNVWLKKPWLSPIWIFATFPMNPIHNLTFFLYFVLPLLNKWKAMNENFINTRVVWKSWKQTQGPK